MFDRKKNGFQIRIVQQKIHNIKEEKALFYITLKENITKSSYDFKMMIEKYSNECSDYESVDEVRLGYLWEAELRSQRNHFCHIIDIGLVCFHQD